MGKGVALGIKKEVGVWVKGLLCEHEDEVGCEVERSKIEVERSPNEALRRYVTFSEAS